MFGLTSLVPFLLSFILGIRHGIDWDHIAAIADLTGATDSKKKALTLGTLYIIGHASVILLLGGIAILIKINLPPWIDIIMERFVGVTLILLGLWLILSLLVHGKQFKMKSSRMLLIKAIAAVYNYLHDKLPHAHHHKHISLPDQYSKKTAYITGIIHGIGAETPTQLLLFLTAAGIGNGLLGIVVLIIFVLGLLVSNFVIICLAVIGFYSARKNASLRITLGTITAVFSLALGTLFLFNKASYLPAIFGG